VSAPLPPSDLNSRDPDLVKVPAGAVMHRFYTDGFEPIFFDIGLSAFAETFLRTPGRRLIDASFLKRKAYVCLQARSELTLIKLAGPGLAILGATAEIVHGGLPYDDPQAWSKALFGHPVNAHGIAYYARHDDEALCYAIFDRASSSVAETARETNLDQDWFWQLALKYKVGLAPS
jgi:hypothetical protein